LEAARKKLIKDETMEIEIKITNSVQRSQDFKIDFKFQVFQENKNEEVMKKIEDPSDADTK